MSSTSPRSMSRSARAGSASGTCSPGSMRNSRRSSWMRTGRTGARRRTGERDGRGVMAIPREACEKAAEELGCDAEAIMAVAQVESGGRTNCKAFLFEPHWFSRLTLHKYDRTHPTVSYPRWDRHLYPSGLKSRIAQLHEA